VVETVGITTRALLDVAGHPRSEGMRNMYEDGLVKSLLGVTTIEEVLRVTQEG